MKRMDENVEMRREEDIPAAEKWAGESCTLDGKPARIIGRRLRFGQVALTDPMTVGRYVVAEYSWTAIDRVMQSGGVFKS